ncbi:MAG: c-type cytochrome [Candidatus Solibacter usitatus]|nr:c-type cytochrome [Candidatus Solibacter usitatus]
MSGAAVILLAGMALAAAQQPPEIPKQNPHQTEADAARGKQLFQGHCAPCHGPGGEGARGPTLARPTLRRAPDDPALYRVIHDGIQDTEMPGAWALNDHEVWQVAAFVRTLGRRPQEVVSGDPARGETLYRGKGKCAQCHLVNMKGGRMGPDLSEAGLRRSAAYLREALLRPEADVPEGFLQVRLTPRRGEAMTAIRLNEDTYSIQVRDLNDRLHSFWKHDLAQLEKQPGKSPMPAYGTVFSVSELDDIVAYLVSLRGVS